MHLPPSTPATPCPAPSGPAWRRWIVVAALCATSAAASASAGFGEHAASGEAREVARWIGQSGDNGGLPFVLIDKVDARVFVFDAAGVIQGSGAALLGSARGDSTAAGIGDMSLSAIRPEDRTTPAGRFVAHLDRDIHGRSILLIDYDASIALHPVVPGTARERRAERLRSETPDDNRISYGCINVLPTFYDSVIRPAFTSNAGVVYILPEDSPARGFFGDQGADAASEAPSLPWRPSSATRMTAISVASSGQAR